MSLSSLRHRSWARALLSPLAVILVLWGPGMAAASVAVAGMRAVAGPRLLSPEEMDLILGGALTEFPDAQSIDCTNNDPPPPCPLDPPTCCPENAGPGSENGQGGNNNRAGVAPGMSAADPISLSTGYVLKYETDVALPVRGDLFFGVRRTFYEQMLGESLSRNIDVGEHWRFSPDIRLYARENSDDLVLRDGLGRARLLVPLSPVSGEQYYTLTRQGFNAYIEIDTGSSNERYTLHCKGGQIYTFDTLGYVYRQYDRNGNYLQYTYDGTPRLTQISPNGVDDGRALKFEYVSSGTYAGNLERVTDASGVPYVTYAYTTVNGPRNSYHALHTVTRRQGVRVTYGYVDKADRLRMDTVTNARNQTIVDYDHEYGNFRWNSEATDGQGNQTLEYISGGTIYDQRWYVFGSDSSRELNVVTNWARDLLRAEETSGAWATYTYYNADQTPGSTPGLRAVEFQDDAAGRRTTYGYENDLTITYTAPHDYFRHSNLVTVTYDNGDESTYTYSHDDYASLLSTVDRLGRYTEYDYDSDGNLTEVTYPNGLSVTYAYDVDGQMTSRRDRLGLFGTYAYNDHGLLTSTGDPLGRITTYSYDEYGNVEQSGDFLGNVTEYEYDSLGRLTRVDLATGDYTTSAYDDDSDLTSSRNARGYYTTYAYDRYEHLTEMHDALGGYTTYSYDRSDNMVNFYDQRRNRAVGYAYDNRGRAIAEGTADSSLYSTYVYDDTGCSSCGGGGQLASSRNRRAEYTEYEYDSDGRLSTAIFHDGERVTFVYDSSSGLPTDMEDSRLALGNGTFQYDYDDDFRLARVIAPEGAVTSYVYDTYSRRQSLIDPDGNVTSYVYDSYGRLERIHNGFGQATTYSFDGYGRPESVEAWNGTSTTRGYDTYGRLTDLVIREADDDVAQRFQYLYDPNGNVSRTTLAYDEGTDGYRYVVYQYDALDRLISEEWRFVEAISGPEPDDYRQWQRNYVYDAVGNRTALGYDNGTTITTTTYQYNSLNQLTEHSSQGGTYRFFSYDDNGDMTARREAASGAGAGNGWTYEWSQDDRLVAVEFTLDEKVGPDARTTFAYDVGGRRLLRQDDDGTWTRYFYDGLNVLLEHEGESDPSGWGSFVADDFEDGDTSGWYAWNGTTLSNLYQTERRSYAMHTVNSTAGNTNAIAGDDNANRNPNDTEWNEARTAFSLAAERIETGIWSMTFYVTTDQGNLPMVYDSWHTTQVDGGTYLAFGLGNPLGGSGASSSDWQVISRDLEADLQALRPTSTLTNIDGFRISRNDLRVDDIRLADARTTRVYTLAPSALGGIISIRDVNLTGANTDTWYHYDRLGNVMLTSNASGVNNGLRWQDAYGNQLTSVDSGAWASAANAEGYGLTTKEFDGDVALYYFWQRWNDPTLGVFVSRSPYPAPLEHPYAYAGGNPTNRFDPTGLFISGGDPAGDTLCALVVGWAYAQHLDDFDSGVPDDVSPATYDSYLHCLISCYVALECGSSAVMALGAIWELMDFLTGDGFSTDDLVADRVGTLCAERCGEGNCHRCCAAAY